MIKERSKGDLREIYRLQQGTEGNRQNSTVCMCSDLPNATDTPPEPIELRLAPNIDDHQTPVH